VFVVLVPNPQFTDRRASDSIAGDLNPVGRLFYAASTMFCVPASMSQEVGLALGAQAGEARLREVVTAGALVSAGRWKRSSTLLVEARP